MSHSRSQPKGSGRPPQRQVGTRRHPCPAIWGTCKAPWLWPVPGTGNPGVACSNLSATVRRHTQPDTGGGPRRAEQRAARP